MVYFFQLLFSGIMVGGIYSLVGIGFVIIYKSTRVINFSQGQLLAVGALMLWVFAIPLKLPIPLSFLLTVVFMALFGAAVEYLFIRPMTGQPLMSVIIMTIGLSVLLDSLIYPIFGGLERSYPHIFPTGGLHFFRFSISYEYLCSFGTALIMVVFFLYFFHRTRSGTLMRAVADSHNIARSCGVKVGEIFRLVWVISAISAMIGGGLWGSVKSVYPNAMTSLAMSVFPVIILGGLDSIPGCMIAGPIVGVLEIMATGYGDPLTQGGAGDVIPYVLILVTLIIRPHGIFGEKIIERI